MHPSYLATEEIWTVIQFARAWREGVLPEPGGVGDQAAWTAAAVEIVLVAWGRLDTARDAARRKD